MQDRVSECPIEGAMVLLSGRWRALILYYLAQGPMRFNALRRANATAGAARSQSSRQASRLRRLTMVNSSIHGASRRACVFPPNLGTSSGTSVAESGPYKVSPTQGKIDPSR